jgi:hypothetical protein
MDYDAYDAILHMVFKRTQEDAWFKPSEEVCVLSVLLVRQLIPSRTSLPALLSVLRLVTSASFLTRSATMAMYLVALY